MRITGHELWTVIHGMGFGSLFLLAFAGGLADLWSLRPAYVSRAGGAERLHRLNAGMWGMALAAWGTVITGTWIVYPWYRDKAATSAKSLLLADSATSAWHTFGMEWKEHVAWVAPLLATSAAFLVTWYGKRLLRDNAARRLAIGLFVAGFATAAAAGLLGAFITKAAPVR